MSGLESLGGSSCFLHWDLSDARREMVAKIRQIEDWDDEEAAFLERYGAENFVGYDELPMRKGFPLPIWFANYKTLKWRVDDFFRECKEKDLTPNIVTLASYLDVSKEFINTWKNTDTDRGAIIEMAYDKCEGAVVQRALDNKSNTQMSIFLLKNRHKGWVDEKVSRVKHEVDEEKRKEIKRALADVKVIDV
jgi:hypothetical protein